MAKKASLFVLLPLFLASLFACRESSILLTDGKKDESGFQIQSPEDGVFVKSGQALSFEVATDRVVDEKNLGLEITITDSTGNVVWTWKVEGPALNTEQDFILPILPEGRYAILYVLREDGTAVEKKTSVLFVTSKEYGINGISSFPPVIGMGSKVLLTADLEVPQGEDPFLRWSARNKVIRTGKLSDGLSTILWTAPSSKGVYPIRLELFPSAPEAGEDFTFLSSCALTTELFVTQEARLAEGDLAPEASYYSLFHMAADLTDDGAAARKGGRGEPKILGDPEITTVGDGFGFLLDGQSGFQFPWLLVPVEVGALKPFTVHMGLQWDGAAVTEEPAGKASAEVAARTILQVKADGDAFSLTVKEDAKTHVPSAVLSVAGVETEIPSGIGAVPAQSRVQLSLSVIPQEKAVTFLWFLDGGRKAAQTVKAEIKGLKGGTTLIGGAGGFAGVIDELGVYYKDAAGRSTCDPSLFSAAAARSYGKQLVLAEGFDGTFLAEGFTLSGDAVPSGGLLSVPEGGAVTLPVLDPGADELTVDLELPAEKTAAEVSIAAKDAEDPMLTVPVAVKDGFFRLVLSAESASYRDAEGRTETVKLPKTGSFVLSVVHPEKSGTSLQLESVLVLRHAIEAAVEPQAETPKADEEASGQDSAAKPKQGTDQTAVRSRSRVPLR